MDAKIILILCLIAPLKSASSLHRSPRCKNQYGDLGICVPFEDCKKSDGINIGFCSSKLISCCHILPCSNLTELFSNTPRRSKRDHKTRPVLFKAQVDPVCGLRFDDEFLEDQKENGGREAQLIGGVSLDFADNRVPWMLGLWVRHFPLSIPTCGAALISTRHAITAAHCVENHRVSGCLQLISDNFSAVESAVFNVSFYFLIVELGK